MAHSGAAWVRGNADWQRLIKTAVDAPEALLAQSGDEYSGSFNLAAGRTFSVRCVVRLDGCKARRAGNGSSMPKRRNADADQTRSPPVGLLA